jgi:hypothetical protein
MSWMNLEIIDELLTNPFFFWIGKAGIASFLGLAITSLEAKLWSSAVCPRRLPAPPACAASPHRLPAPSVRAARAAQPIACVARHLPAPSARITSSRALQPGGKIADRVVYQPTRKLALEVGWGRCNCRPTSAAAAVSCPEQPAWTGRPEGLGSFAGRSARQPTLPPVRLGSTASLLAVELARRLEHAGPRAAQGWGRGG